MLDPCSCPQRERSDQIALSACIVEDQIGGKLGQLGRGQRVGGGVQLVEEVAERWEV